MMENDDLPEFREWSVAAVRLLQGVIYSDEPRVWNSVLSSQSTLTDYFARLGLRLVVDEPEGLAFLRQLADDELPESYDRLPKLFRKTRLGYEVTLLLVLLREELRRFEEEEVHDERCVIETDALFEQWKVFLPAQNDDVRQHKELTATLNKVEDLGFIRKFSDEPEGWEIRRILKARLPAAELENLKLQLLTAAVGK